MKKFPAAAITLLTASLLAACTKKTAPQPIATCLPPPTFQNPILPGFHPDPSICRVNNDYYLVTSSFEYFPGVPLFHSTDLIHWQQLTYILSRPSQLNLDHVKPSTAGIFAPTLRYHNNTFYLITTLSDNTGNHNFIVTAPSPTGPWSDPHFLPNAPGIDPSLFFDDDNSAWYTGNQHPDAGESYPHHRQIWLQQINLSTFTLIGPKTIIEDQGALKHANSAEAPHLYKFNNYYYLMIAEGGTGSDHAVTISRSKSITGPYEPDYKNPILTHRNLGKDYPIQSTGHADLVQTQAGDWWLVLLATRPYGKSAGENLGRETFLAPVSWQNNFPIVAPNDGKVELDGTLRPNLPNAPFPPQPTRDDFNSPTLNLNWNFLRTPRSNFYSLTARPGFLRLNLRPEQCTELTNPSWIGRRQEHMSFSASTSLDFTPQTNSESAGLTAFYNNDFHFRFLKTLSLGKPVLQLIQRKAAKETLLAEQPIPTGPIQLTITAFKQDYRFLYQTPGTTTPQLLFTANGSFLNHNAAGGYTGAYLALYATSANHPSTNHADFDFFDYQPNP